MLPNPKVRVCPDCNTKHYFEIANLGWCRAGGLSWSDGVTDWGKEIRDKPSPRSGLVHCAGCRKVMYADDMPNESWPQDDLKQFVEPDLATIHDMIERGMFFDEGDSKLRHNIRHSRQLSLRWLAFRKRNDVLRDGEQVDIDEQRVFANMTALVALLDQAPAWRRSFALWQDDGMAKDLIVADLGDRVTAAEIVRQGGDFAQARHRLEACWPLASPIENARHQGKYARNHLDWATWLIALSDSGDAQLRSREPTEG